MVEVREAEAYDSHSSIMNRRCRAEEAAEAMVLPTTQQPTVATSSRSRSC